MRESEKTVIRRKGVYPQYICKVVANAEGFTLVEAILVVVLLAVVSATFMPKFFDTTAISIEGAAEMVAADIRYAQELAMSTHQDKTIIFTATNTYYTVDSKTVNLPSSVSISTGATFTFNSLGEPTTGGGSSMQLEAGSNTKTVTVENYTGKVTIS